MSVPFYYNHEFDPISRSWKPRNEAFEDIVEEPVSIDRPAPSRGPTRRPTTSEFNRKKKYLPSRGPTRRAAPNMDVPAPEAPAPAPAPEPAPAPNRGTPTPEPTPEQGMIDSVLYPDRPGVGGMQLNPNFGPGESIRIGPNYNPESFKAQTPDFTNPYSISMGNMSAFQLPEMLEVPELPELADDATDEERKAHAQALAQRNEIIAQNNETKAARTAADRALKESRVSGMSLADGRSKIKIGETQGHGGRMYAQERNMTPEEIRSHNKLARDAASRARLNRRKLQKFDDFKKNSNLNMAVSDWVNQSIANAGPNGRLAGRNFNEILKNDPELALSLADQFKARSASDAVRRNEARIQKQGLDGYTQEELNKELMDQGWTHVADANGLRLAPPEQVASMQQRIKDRNTNPFGENPFKSLEEAGAVTRDMEGNYTKNPDFQAPQASIPQLPQVQPEGNIGPKRLMDSREWGTGAFGVDQQTAPQTPQPQQQQKPQQNQIPSLDNLLEQNPQMSLNDDEEEERRRRLAQGF